MTDISDPDQVILFEWPVRTENSIVMRPLTETVACPGRGSCLDKIGDEKSRPDSYSWEMYFDCERKLEGVLASLLRVMWIECRRGGQLALLRHIFVAPRVGTMLAAGLELDPLPLGFVLRPDIVPDKPMSP